MIKNVKTKEKIEKYHIVLLSIILLFMSLSFFRITPYWIKKESSYLLHFTTYYLYFFELIRLAKFIPMIIAISMLCYYVFSFTTIILIVLRKTSKAIMFFTIASLSLVIGVFSFSRISSYSIFVSVIYNVMLIIYLYKNKREGNTLNMNNRKNNERMIIGSNIKKKRNEIGLTQQEIADKLYISRSLVAKVEAGNAMLDEKQMLNLSIVFGCSVEDFYN